MKLANFCVAKISNSPILFAPGAQRILFCEAVFWLPPRGDKTLENGKQRRTHRLRVVVDDNEKAAIEETAEVCSQSVSTYLRNLGLGYVPRSQIDKRHILELIKVSSDQGRLGGLLKMWLSNEELQEELVSGQVRQVLAQIDEVQELLLEKIKGLNGN